MRITEPLVLAEDVEIVPVRELPDDVRSCLDVTGEDFAVSRPRSRSSSVLVDALAAGLLGRFRQPSTLAEALLSFSREQGIEPDQILGDVCELARNFLSRRFLVPAADREAAAGIQPSLAPGDRFSGLVVTRVVQTTEDVEIYRVHTPEGRKAALKLERTGAAQPAGSLIQEEKCLRHLDGGLAPRLLDAGVAGSRRYLLTEWCPGRDVLTTADAWRGRLGAAARDRLLTLCRRVASSYARLHGAGVLHGDVHPRNLRVGSGGSLKLLDFGLARFIGATAAPEGPPRGGVLFYLEPEHARCLLEETPPAPLTARGEQYSVAALLYRLLAGDHYLSFRLERTALLRQIVVEDPIHLAGRQSVADPRFELAIRRALSKEPGHRFPSLQDLCRALDPNPPAATP